jgi:uncharacterized protein (TIGR03083 family)
MSTAAEITANLDRTWSSLGALAGALTDTQWSTPSLCPDWSVFEVLAHVTTIEEALTGWWPEAPDSPPPFAAMGPIFRELVAGTPAALEARFRGAVARRREELAALAARADDAFATPCLTPVGPGTYGRFMVIRVFDCWVHERDMRVPLALPTDDGGPAAEMALDEVQGSLGYIVGKRIGVPDGGSIVFDLTGPVRRRLAVKVDGRAAVVDAVADPDVVVTTDSLTFMLLACGRVDPETAIADGRVTWAGDGTLGARAARNLRFTM